MDEKYWDPPPNLLEWQEPLIEIQEKKIQYETDEDKIILGGNLTSHFNLKEAYNYITIHEQCQHEHKWKTLWERKHWPKITLFLWLIMYKKNNL